MVLIFIIILKQGNLDWKTVLENIKDTYDPAAPGRNVSAYGFYIGGTDLPLHQHAVAVGKTKSGDKTIKL